MVDGSFVPIFAIFVGLVVAAIAIRSGQQQRIAKLRHDLYVKMLESGRVTKDEMEEMLHGVGGESRRRPREDSSPHGSFARLLVAVGWLGLMTALGLFVASRVVTSLDDREPMTLASVIVGAVSLGLVGLPIGIRELTGGTRNRERSAR